MSNNVRKRVIISVSGSLVSTSGGIGVEFLSKFNKFIRERLEGDKNLQFFLVIGGGSIARHYIEGGRNVLGHELTRDDLDWLGIHATRMNAHLVRTVFRDIAHSAIVFDYAEKRDFEEKVVVAAGWKPGWSTDYCSILLCEYYNEHVLVNLGALNKLYDKDPKIHADAESIDNISWRDFKKLVGETWSPGMHAPLDPVATKKAAEMGARAVILSGHDLENLKKYFDGEEFVGTVIE